MKRVLVIEDNEANMYLMEFMLKKNNFEVIQARDGLAGIQKATTEKPDLIIMDIQLPDINGLEATHKIRENETTRNIPIVAVTSYAIKGDREKALAAGCTGYIEKPINPEVFLQSINSYL